MVTARTGSYEWIRERLKPAGARKEDCDATATLVAGGAAGLLMWAVVYPADVVKSRVQMSENKLGIQLIGEMIQNAGLRGLYCGLLPTLIKTVPVTAVTMITARVWRDGLRGKRHRLIVIRSD